MLLIALALQATTMRPIQPERPLLALSFNVPNNAGEEEYIGSLREQIRFGLNGFYVSVKWSEIETSPGTFEFKKLEDSLGLAKMLGADVALTIQSLDTTQRGVPADLAETAFDNPELQRRWKSFLTEVSKKLPKRVRWISLGNEVDAYLRVHVDEVPGYMQFLQVGRQALRENVPQAKVGVTCTFDGYQKEPALIEKLEAWTDVVFMTYYPLTQQFGPRPLNEVPRDFLSMVKLATGRKLILQEIGLPASELVGSSEQIQADFVSEVFKQLAKHSERVVFANYFLQYDFQPPLMDILEAYYGMKDARFKAFLGSLGLKKTDGTPRKAWSSFKEGAYQWFKAGP